MSLLDLFDLFDPSPHTQARRLTETRRRTEKVEARLDTVTQAQNNARMRLRMRQRDTSDGLEQTQDDLGFVALCLMSVVRRLVKKGLLTQEELLETMQELDGVDGATDQKLDIGVMRQATGMPASESDDEPEPEAPRRLKRRRRR